MAGLQSSSSFGHAPARGFSLLRTGADHGEDARSTWALAAAGFAVAWFAAWALCLSPRWFTNSPAMIVLQSARIVLTTAAIGGAAVWSLWYVVSNKPSAGAAWIARNLSVGWVFLPCFVLFYQTASAWTLAFAALVAAGFALSLRRLLPPLAEESRPRVETGSLLPSLDGLPPADSPLLLSACVATLLQGTLALAAGSALLLASLLLAGAVFLLTWRWSAYEVRAAEWWGGGHPPLRQLAAAICITSIVLVPYTIGEKFGWRLHTATLMPKAPPPREATANSGYFGIILYPPPTKKQLISPVLHEETSAPGTLARPMVIPFDGPYWYFKDAWHKPGPRAHVAHGRPTDSGINVRSTDLQPMMMEAHQRLLRPIDLAACGEIDVTVSNADRKPGEIDLILLLADSSLPGRPRQVLPAQTILSSAIEHIAQDRAPVREVLRFPVPANAHLRRFDDLTLQFILAPLHARAGPKVAIESFELIPRH